MIIDASVALKWVLKEPDSGRADVLASRQDLTAPAVLAVETAYVLTKRVRQRVVSAAEARWAWKRLASVRVVLIDDQSLVDASFDLSLRLAANFYDCLYLALAVAQEDLLVTADESFVRTVRTAPELTGYIQTLAEATA